MTRHICVASTHLARRLHRAVRPNCRPRAAVRSGLGAQIKHDGYRLIARRQNTPFPSARTRRSASPRIHDERIHSRRSAERSNGM
jgi:hypothetical protein